MCKTFKRDVLHNEIEGGHHNLPYNQYHHHMFHCSLSLHIGKLLVLWFYGGVASSLTFFAWEAYATNVGKSLLAFKVEVTMNPILETLWSRTVSTDCETSQFDDIYTSDKNIFIK